jgi:hypothetical protein
MAVHLQRDYLVLNSNVTRCATSYIVAIFLRRVLGFSFVGHTNFDIENVGTLLLASGTTVGNRAGINFGAVPPSAPTAESTAVSIPVGVRTVSAADIGRILVLRSTTNPKHNSGCFAISSVDTVNNRYRIDWRSAEAPPPEAADSMDWWLYASDANAPSINVSGSQNGGPGYNGNGSSTTPRLILQSPHSTGWQLRICHETLTEQNSPRTSTPSVTMTVGFNGTAAGDFLVGGRHCHGSLFFDAATSRWRGLNPGFAFNVGAQQRITIIGDDTGQAVVWFARNVGTPSASSHMIFGLPDEEVVPLPTDPLNRIFSLGQQFGNYSALSFGMYLTNTDNVLSAGSTFGFSGQPVTCTTGCWTYLTHPSANTSPFFDATAGDNPWLGATELLTVQLFAGTWHTSAAAVGSFLTPTEPRQMGLVPYLRQGRTNFGDFVLSTDKAWRHMRNGTYVPWEGPAVLP